MRARALIAFAIALGACVPDTSREPVALAVEARGVSSSTRTFGDHVVRLVDARVAVGPIYFCSAAQASAELCGTARLELLEPFVVDLLDPSPQAGGLAYGTTGRVSSAQFDLGRSHPPAAGAPSATTEALGGRSAVFFFEVEGPARSFSVDLELSLDPPRAGSTLVMGARTAADVTPESEAVTLRFDPFRLLGSIDLAALEAAAEEGVILTPSPGDQAYESVALRLTDGRDPTFEWSSP